MTYIKYVFFKYSWTERSCILHRAPSSIAEPTNRFLFMAKRGGLAVSVDHCPRSWSDPIDGRPAAAAAADPITFPPSLVHPSLLAVINSIGIHSIGPNGSQSGLSVSPSARNKCVNRHSFSYRVFRLTVQCGEINRGGIPKVPKPPIGAPEVDPNTRGRNTL